MQTKQQILMKYRLNFLQNAVEKYLISIIDHNISRSCFFDGAKSVIVIPTYKKKDRKNKENCRPLSILNWFSKVYERFIIDVLIEKWKKNLDNNKIVSGVFIDLSKAFDCIPYNLLIAKVEGYSLENNPWTLTMSAVCF